MKLFRKAEVNLAALKSMIPNLGFQKEDCKRELTSQASSLSLSLVLCLARSLSSSISLSLSLSLSFALALARSLARSLCLCLSLSLSISLLLARSLSLSLARSLSLSHTLQARAGVSDRGEAGAAHSCFTGFTGKKVQILTQLASQAKEKREQLTALQDLNRDIDIFINDFLQVC